MVVVYSAEPLEVVCCCGSEGRIPQVVDPVTSVPGDPASAGAPDASFTGWAIGDPPTPGPGTPAEAGDPDAVIEGWAIAGGTSVWEVRAARLRYPDADLATARPAAPSDAGATDEAMT